jgi:hypothetical protein
MDKPGTTPENVKLLLPPRQSRGVSLRTSILVYVLTEPNAVAIRIQIVSRVRDLRFVLAHAKGGRSLLGPDVDRAANMPDLYVEHRSETNGAASVLRYWGSRPVRYRTVRCGDSSRARAIWNGRVGRWSFTTGLSQNRA